MRRLAFARETRGDAEPGQPYLAGRLVEHDVGWLDIFMNQPALVKLAQSCCDGNRNTQEGSRLHGRAEQPFERLAARILEHQHGPARVAYELQRPHCPRRVELVLQLVFVREALEA